MTVADIRWHQMKLDDIRWHQLAIDNINWEAFKRKKWQNFWRAPKWKWPLTLPTKACSWLVFGRVTRRTRWPWVIGSCENLPVYPVWDISRAALKTCRKVLPSPAIRPCVIFKTASCIPHTRPVIFSPAVSKKCILNPTVCIIYWWSVAGTLIICIYVF